MHLKSAVSEKYDIHHLVANSSFCIAQTIHVCFWQKKRFFGDAGSGTLDHLLQKTAKHVSLSPAPSKYGMGPYLGPLRPRKHCFGPKNGFFWPFLAKNAFFLVMAALKPLTICSKPCKTRFSESNNLKIGYGALQLTTQARKTLFWARKWHLFAIFGQKLRLFW